MPTSSSSDNLSVRIPCEYGSAGNGLITFRFESYNDEVIWMEFDYLFKSDDAAEYGPLHYELATTIGLGEADVFRKTLGDLGEANADSVRLVIDRESWICVSPTPSDHKFVIGGALQYPYWGLGNRCENDPLATCHLTAPNGNSPSVFLFDGVVAERYHLDAMARAIGLAIG